MSVYTRWRSRLRARQALLAHAEAQAHYWRVQKHKATKGTARYSHCGYMLADREKKVKLRREQVAYAQRVVDRHKPIPLRLKAYAVAESLVGVMEVGGNNRGPMVDRIIKANDGPGPEPWCGDFQAYCYRKAGSKAVQRLWCSVAWLGKLAGLSKTSSPQKGDLVRFTFSHVGMFVRDLGNGYIETIEGNTGASGAISDSTTGGDGVYRKQRSKSLVLDYLHVTR